jgi:hypothetical protein
MNLQLEFDKYKASLLEAKNNQSGAKPVPVNDPQFLFCDLWRESYAKNMSLPDVETGVKDFLLFKAANPLARYRSKDTGFTNPAVFPGINHAHITRDVSIFYSIEGRDPRKIKMYGVFTHNQSGTGTPQNINIQKSLTRTMKNQVFSSTN